MKKTGFRLCAAALASCWLAGSAHADIDMLSAEDAYVMVQRGELVLLDVRTPSEWAMTGMPKNSIGAPLTSADFILQARGAVLGDLEYPVAVICRAGSQSSDAAQKLASEGFAQIYVVAEGMAGELGKGEGWIKRGLPTDPFIPPDR